MYICAHKQHTARYAILAAILTAIYSPFEAHFTLVKKTPVVLITTSWILGCCLVNLHLTRHGAYLLPKVASIPSILAYISSLLLRSLQLGP